MFTEKLTKRVYETIHMLKLISTVLLWINIVSIMLGVGIRLLSPNLKHRHQTKKQTNKQTLYPLVFVSNRLLYRNVLLSLCVNNGKLLKTQLLIQIQIQTQTQNHVKYKTANSNSNVHN
jgi:hypothetical protein